MRKHILHPQPPPSPGEMPVASLATIFMTSEETGHPIDCAFDAQRGPGGTRWVAGTPGEQTVIVAFDSPQMIRYVTLEIEERDLSRTQELQLAVSTDGGESYREICRQEFNFSPGGATFEREEWTVSQANVSHVRIWIKPDKGGAPCRATLTTLAFR